MLFYKKRTTLTPTIQWQVQDRKRLTKKKPTEDFAGEKYDAVGMIFFL